MPMPETVKIVQKDDPVLRKKAEKVEVSNISSPKIKKIILDMRQALATQDDGIAIAAPQIGESLRIFIVSGAVLRAALNGLEKVERNGEPDLIFINPEIIKISKEKQESEEGCLSVRWKYGMTKRAKKVTIKFYDENGKHTTRGVSGLLAQVFQHEIDHLDGVLFIDIAKNVEEIPPEEIEKHKKANINGKINGKKKNKI